MERGNTVAPRRKLGDILLEAGVITKEQLDTALQRQKTTQLKLGEQLVEMGLLTEQQLIELLERQLGIAHVKLYQETIDRNVLSLIPQEIANRYFVLPIRKMGNRLIVAMADPLDYYAIDDLRLRTGMAIVPVIARRGELRAAINRYYGMQQSIQQMMQEISEEEQAPAAETDTDAPAARMVQQLIRQGIELQASDIHLDPQEDETVIRLRVDGILRIERTLPRNMHSVVVSRIKILAGLNIAEKRLPQDGRFQTTVDGAKVDVRVSVLPTIFGEKAVLRLLDMGKVLTRLEQLHFSNENLARFQSLIRRPYGLVLVTGPTGSGKTTTLYAALQSLNRPEVNIITVEDPVEYQIKGINQMQVNPLIGLTFAAGLRAILRQDPNIVMVGEIRDTETAEMALQAALTGHLVLSTLHTNDAASSITRLIDMGIQPYMVSSALAGVVAQRLVRRVCPYCAVTVPVHEALNHPLPESKLTISHAAKGKGCPQCYHTGYRGRLAIHEVLEVDETLRRLIVSQPSETALREHLHKKAFKTMVDDGLAKAAAGLTSLDEVFRAALFQEEETDHVV